MHVAPNVTSRYGCRQFGLIHAVPDVVVFPGSTTEVAEVLRGAYACGIPVVQRLATRYLSGGMIVLTGGIVLALDRMNRIIEERSNNTRDWLGTVPRHFQCREDRTNRDRHVLSCHFGTHAPGSWALPCAVRH